MNDGPKLENALLIGASLLTFFVIMEQKAGDTKTIMTGVIATACVLSWAHVTGKRLK